MALSGTDINWRYLAYAKPIIIREYTAYPPQIYRHWSNVDRFLVLAGLATCSNTSSARAWHTSDDQPLRAFMRDSARVTATDCDGIIGVFWWPIILHSDSNSIEKHGYSRLTWWLLTPTMAKQRITAPLRTRLEILQVSRSCPDKNKCAHPSPESEQLQLQFSKSRAKHNTIQLASRRGNKTLGSILNRKPSKLHERILAGCCGMEPLHS